MLDVPTVSALPAARTVELSISGMTCAACAARVEKKLTRITPGVVAAVNFATERATWHGHLLSISAVRGLAFRPAAVREWRV